MELEDLNMLEGKRQEFLLECRTILLECNNGKKRNVSLISFGDFGHEAERKRSLMA